MKMAFFLLQILIFWQGGQKNKKIKFYWIKEQRGLWLPGRRELSQASDFRKGFLSTLPPSSVTLYSSEDFALIKLSIKRVILELSMVLSFDKHIIVDIT